MGGSLRQPDQEAEPMSTQLPAPLPPSSLVKEHLERGREYESWILGELSAATGVKVHRASVSHPVRPRGVSGHLRRVLPCGWAAGEWDPARGEVWALYAGAA